MRILLAFFERFIDMSGGIEHVCCNMANELVRRGHEVSIVYCYGEDGRPFYPLDEKVGMYNLMTLSGRSWKQPHLGKNVSGRDKFVREVLRAFSKSAGREWNEGAKARMVVPAIQKVVKDFSPDVIVSFRYETSNYLINYAKVSVPVITMFHIDPDNALPTAPKGEIKAIEKSAWSQVLLKGDIEKVKKYCPKANLIRIPNVVPQYEEQADVLKEKKQYTIIDVARLNKEQKRQHLLIEAFSRLAKDYPEWKVDLWGRSDGDNAAYTKELRELIEKLHLEKQVFLKGENPHISKVYEAADIFAFPSAYEGFPLSMTEAMSAGLPVVAFKSCFAAAELIDPGKTGLVAEDGAEGMAAALKELMDNKEKRASLGLAAREAMKEFEAEKIWDQWEALLEKTAR